ncbi:peptidoglycan-binding protein [Alsobacter soli]|nr:peptidoglycan-binding protein [Alsobacter soli]
MANRCRRRAPALLGLAAMACLSAPGASSRAAAQGAPPPAAKQDPAYDAARSAFDQLPEADRKAVQEALIWTGDFAGAGTGGFGPLTFRAIVAFQKRLGVSSDGILQPKDRAALDAAAARAKQALGFAKIAEPRSGVRIGVPGRLFDRPPQPVPGGVRYTGPGGALLETISLPGGPADLPALFDRYKADGPGRRTTYKVLRPDWFVTAADLEGRKTYTRIASGPAGLRGFTFTYPATPGNELDRLAIAVANSFEPFPTTPAQGGPRANAGPAPGPASAAPPAPASGPTLLGSALVVAPGRAVTTAPLAACAAPTVDRKPAKVLAVDKAAGLGLLEAAGLRAPALPVAADSLADGAPLVALGLSGAPDPQLAVAAAEARAPAGAATLRVFAPLQKGAAGTVIFDRRGRVAGLVAGDAPEPRMVAGVAPATSWPAVSGAAVARFLAANGVQPGAGAGSAEPLSAGQIAAAAKGAVLAVECPKAP